MQPITSKEHQQAFGFLFTKLMDMKITTEDGHEICPLFGFCECDNEDCFMDRYMETFTPLCKECGAVIKQGE